MTKNTASLYEGPHLNVITWPRFSTYCL